MKANFAVVFLSFLSLSLPLKAQPNPTPSGEEVVKQVDAIPKINLNTADIQTLSHSVKGIGKKRAEAIIKYREAHQGIKSIDELGQVTGLGQHFVEKNKEQLEQTFTLE